MRKVASVFGAALLLALMMSVLCVPAFAADVDPSRDTWGFQMMTSEQAEISFYNSNDETAVIPAEYNGVPVTAIGADAFAGRDALKGVTIPETIGRIKEGAFRNCPSLLEVHIPDSVDRIGDKAFGYITDGTEARKVPGFRIIGSIGSAAEAYAKENGFGFVAPGAGCTHNVLTCNNTECGMTLTKDEWLELWSKAGNSSTTFSEGDLTIIVGIAALTVGLVGGLLIGRKRRSA